MQVVRWLSKMMKKGMKGLWLGLKVIVQLIGVFAFTVFCTIINFQILCFFSAFDLKAFYPMVPSCLGESNTYALVVDETISQQPLIMGEFQRPNLETTSDPLARYLFQDLKLPTEEVIEDQTDKIELIQSLFPFQTLDSVAPYVEIIQQLPKELLELMVRDELYFIVSNYSPKKIGENKQLLGYYASKGNRIILYDSPNTPTAVIHEIGHWVESYLEHHIDFFYAKRIGNEMMAELESLNLPTFLLSYAKTDIHEFFAVSFEVYFYHYEWVKSQAPTMFEYFSYYMIELLKTYDN